MELRRIVDAASTLNQLSLGREKVVCATGASGRDSAACKVIEGEHQDPLSARDAMHRPGHPRTFHMENDAQQKVRERM